MTGDRMGDARAVLQRGRIRAAMLKPAALFLLPTPLLFAILGSLIAGDVSRLALTGGALASFWGAGVLALRGVVDEARYLLGERLDAPAVPLKVLAAAPTATGAALAATAGGHDILPALVFGALGAAGHLMFFGRGVRPVPIRVAEVVGVDAAAVTLQLKEAHGRLRSIEGAARTIALPEFRERLARIAATTRNVLSEIERDPADAARARRFLNLYLESAARVTADFARTQTHGRNPALEENFRRLLVEMENTFTEQHRRLVAHEQLLLDADIEVLNTRLTREGPG
jgi:5-bromo-4-chloroindolyl phosphate hydrolysis protein